MFFCEINPFLRFTRELAFSQSSSVSEVFPIEARFFYVTKGTGEIYVDKKALSLSEGNAVLINSGIPYRIVPSDITFLAINFDWTQNFCNYTLPVPPVASKNKKNFTPFEHIRFEDCKEFNQYAYLKNAFFAETALKNIINCYKSKQAYCQLELNSMLTLLLIECAKHLTKRDSPFFDIENVVDYLQSHYNEEITNLKISEIFHFHPNYISSKFSNAFGKPLHKYLLDLRITKAIELLETGLYSIEDIAKAVGFCDTNYFTRYFKKVTGKTPKKIY